MNLTKSKVVEAISKSGLDAILALGADNFAYLTGAVLPFAESYPGRRAAVLISKDGSGFVICPFDWSEAIRDQGWGGEIACYDENEGTTYWAFASSLGALTVNLGLSGGKIGVDYSRASRSLMDTVEAELDRVVWASCESLLRRLRIVKTREEIELIEVSCKQLDRGIIHALNHLEGTVTAPGYTLAEFTERIRVHINENGSSGIGHMSTTLEGDMGLYYAPSRGHFREGVPFKVDVSSHYKGYWGHQGRMCFTGKTPPEYAEAYVANLRVKVEAENLLRPGVKCSELFAKVKTFAKDNGITLLSEVGMGHGVGVSHHEPPYINVSDDTEFQEGMVVALDVYTLGPRDGLIHSKDVYAVGDKGSRKLSWYRDWTVFYEVKGFRATH